MFYALVKSKKFFKGAEKFTPRFGKGMIQLVGLLKIPRETEKRNSSRRQRSEL